MHASFWVLRFGKKNSFCKMRKTCEFWGHVIYIIPEAETELFSAVGDWVSCCSDCKLRKIKLIKCNLRWWGSQQKKKKKRFHDWNCLVQSSLFPILLNKCLFSALKAHKVNRNKVWHSFCWHAPDFVGVGRCGLCGQHAQVVFCSASLRLRLRVPAFYLH